MMHDPANAPRLGQILTVEPQRDAIHIAIAPVIAGEFLRPGFHVGVSDGKALQTATPHVGIVDPFLTVDVQPGQRVYLLLYPYTITSLRHEWIHPAFATLPTDLVSSMMLPLEKQYSEAWLRRFASFYEIDYSELIDDLVSGGGVCFGSEGERDEAMGRRAELMRHVGVVTGQVFTDDQIENTRFSCSC